MIFEEQKGLAMGYIWSINGSRGVIGMLSGVFCWFRGVATEANDEFRAYDGRESLRLNRRESVNDNIFNPGRMVKRKAVGFVKYDDRRIQGKKLFQNWVWYILKNKVGNKKT